MDPHRATREEFTTGLISQPLPGNANAGWKRYTEAHQKLLDKLAHHPAMAPNLTQTYMTPAASKNRIYFMWDFVGRTLGMCFQLPAAKNTSQYNTAQSEIWSDVRSRTAMAKTLLTDSMPEMLNQMIESTNPDERGRHPELGDELLALANALPDL